MHRASICSCLALAAVILHALASPPAAAQDPAAERLFAQALRLLQAWVARKLATIVVFTDVGMEMVVEVLIQPQ